MRDDVTQLEFEEFLMSNLPCPCGSDVSFSKCCDGYIRGKRVPETAEALMRSRYTAYVIGNVPYLLESRHPDFITENEALDIQSWIKDVTSWDKLEILVAEKGTAKDKLGWVAFNVFFHQGDREESMCEYSRFSRLNGRWVYEEGELG
jgi:SEC-C motif domain protein